MSTPTPRSDAAYDKLVERFGWVDAIDALEIARSLELELQAKDRTIEGLRKALDDAVDRLDWLANAHPCCASYAKSEKALAALQEKTT